ncbi:hypothetical protein H5410_035412 [Solanum commersonii]|uniref:Choline monooxygenase, chloroplastic n=1 Tax=Solanum commersonii TaxID=4109 RepID=A0A9J5Y4L0_SOLCO|nr:hypothetical protein H5410_035412 [Solanum commersonii]
MAMLQNFSSFHQSIKITPFKIHIFTRNCVKPRKHYYHSFQISCNYTQKSVLEFDPKIPIEEAITPPSSWYTDSCFYTHELNQVFFKGWQSVGYTEQIKEPRQYFTGRLGNVEYVVCRDDGGKIHAFHNVCRHRASPLASASGKNSCFVCPYHGWTYGLDGALLKATRITGIKNFSVNEMGLVPVRVAIWGPFILVNFENGVLPKEEADVDLVGNEWLGNSSQILTDGGVDSSLSFLCRREYTIECNWKVYCDNYLDGGYHIPYVHKSYASALKLDSLSITVCPKPSSSYNSNLWTFYLLKYMVNIYSQILEKVSIQRCDAEKDQEFDRLGSKPGLYAFVYPNFMINRYGPWMDTNLVLPQGPRKCLVIFDYFLDSSHKGDESFIAQSLEDSETVQIEDMKICEAVQRGLESPAYCSGPYAPQVEKAVHHFHSLLYQKNIIFHFKIPYDYNQKLVLEFDPKIPIEEAITPPSSWYTDSCFYTHELNQVFFKGWQAVGYTEQIKEPRQYFTGRLGNVEYVVCRDDGGKIHAFHNVCRHHASLLASGSGKSSCFVCLYHGTLNRSKSLGNISLEDWAMSSMLYVEMMVEKYMLFTMSVAIVPLLLLQQGWTYGLDGALQKATRIAGIKNFRVNEMGLVPVRVAVWGPFILLNLENGVLPEEEADIDLVGNEWLGNSSQILTDGGVDSSLSFLCRREYTVECNWKVYCDNYLDGGYHVPYVHKSYASVLKLDSYSTTIHEKVSIQRCDAEKDQEFDRLGSKPALYAFVYPNFMISRYGPWMDTNLVLPQGPRKCLVIFDYFLDSSHKGDESFIAQSLEDSETVQIEDMKLCEAVQRGLESPAYCSGRYVPQVEKARSKSLHATALMANRTSSKRKLKTKMGSSSKAKDAKTKKKRGRKVAPPILRATLPMNMKYVIKHIPKQPLSLVLLTILILKKT